MLRRSTLEIPRGSGIGGITSFSSSTYMQLQNIFSARWCEGKIKCKIGDVGHKGENCGVLNSLHWFSTTATNENKRNIAKACLCGVFFAFLQRDALENDFIPAGWSVDDFLSVLVSQIIGNLLCGFGRVVLEKDSEMKQESL